MKKQDNSCIFTLVKKRLIALKQYFAERNGYITNSDVILKDGISSTVINVISSCVSKLEDALNEADESSDRAPPWTSFTDFSYYKICLAVWTHFFNRRSNTYGYKTGDNDAIQSHLLHKTIPWYTKLSMLEFILEYMGSAFKDKKRAQIKEAFILDLNTEFERVHYGYRIINNTITDIISDEEKGSLQEALSNAEESVKSHMKQALALYAQKPEADYKNSIKESISAVEALFRIKTGENTFGPAYAKIKKSITIHPRIQEAIQKVYDYTNQPDTGIRHSKVEGDETMVPDASECQFMIIICSAIINYIQDKYSKATNNLI